LKQPPRKSLKRTLELKNRTPHKKLNRVEALPPSLLPEKLQPLNPPHSPRHKLLNPQLINPRTPRRISPKK